MQGSESGEDCPAVSVTCRPRHFLNGCPEFEMGWSGPRDLHISSLRWINEEGNGRFEMFLKVHFQKIHRLVKDDREDTDEHKQRT
jgi:hypothetical protein